MVDLRLWIGVESSVRSFRVRRETDYDNVSWVRSCPNSIIIPWDGLGTVRGMSHPEPVQTSSKLPTWMYSPASAFLLSTSDLSVTLHTSHFYFWYWSPWPDAGSYWKVLFNKYVDYGTKSGIYKQRSGERKCDLHKYWNFFFFFWLQRGMKMDPARKNQCFRKHDTMLSIMPGSKRNHIFSSHLQDLSFIDTCFINNVCTEKGD
jgi:hypothetical protein